MTTPLELWLLRHTDVPRRMVDGEVGLLRDRFLGFDRLPLPTRKALVVEFLRGTPISLPYEAVLAPQIRKELADRVVDALVAGVGAAASEAAFRRIMAAHPPDWLMSETPSINTLHRRIGHWYERTLTRERKDEIILRALTSAIDAFNAHTTPLPHHLVQHLLALASGKDDDM